MTSLSYDFKRSSIKYRKLDTVSQCGSFQSDDKSIDTDYVEDKNYVYIVGNVNANFPNLSVEKEFYQACILSNETESKAVDLSILENVNDEVGLSRVNQNASLDNLLYEGLGNKKNFYVAREMNWFFSNLDNNEVYSLLPISDDNLIQFIAALGLHDQPIIMVGQLLDNGQVLVSNLIPTKLTPFYQLIENEMANSLAFKELADEILSLNTSDGFQNTERALNYVLYHNKAIYDESYSLCYKANASGPNPSGYQLVNVESHTYWSGKRLIAKIIFNYQGINTGAKQSWYSSVDVTGEYPFVVTNWSRFLPHF